MNLSRRLVPAAAILVALPLLAAHAEGEQPELPRELPTAELTAEITAEQFLARAALLASEEFEGRESGTQAGRKTEDYVAAEFARMGLEPFGDDDSYFTNVNMPQRTPDIADSWLALVPAATEGAEPAEPVRIGGDDAVAPMGMSANAEVEGELVFVGFGLRDAENEYDDYDGVDVTDKIVLVLRHGPSETDPSSPWTLRSRNMRARRLLSFSAKVAAAQVAGAAGVIFVNDYDHEEDAIPAGIPGALQQIPVVTMSRTAAETLMEGTGGTLKERQALIDADRTPRSQVLGKTVRLRASLESDAARNVLAIRPGTDESLKNEAVVVGAHIDHVGYGFFGSAARAQGEMHNGADDNASGTAALLELAELVAAAGDTRRTIIFAGWCGEEKGLIGSRHYAANPRWPLADTVACVNMDMVGYYRPDETVGGINLGGAPTGTGLTELVEKLAAEGGAELRHTWNAWQQSDHFAFYAKDVPSLFFTTGLHPDYHKPGDDWWKLNADGAAVVTKVVAATVTALAQQDGRPEFREKPPRPVLGVRLGDDPNRKGALIGFVFPNSGAGNAGIEAGDLIVSWAGEPVDSSGTLGKLIGSSTVGEEIEVTYVRGGESNTAQVVLQGR